MSRRTHVAIAVFAAAFASTGCVSTSEFDQMKQAKDNEIAALKQQVDALQQDNSGLKTQKTSLETESASLKEKVNSSEQQAAAMQEKNAAIQQQVGTLEQEKAALLAAAQQRQQQYDDLVKGLSAEVEKGQLQVKQYQNMLTVDLAEQIFFDSGRAELKPGGKDVLKKVGTALKKMDNKVIRVVGHTDNVPVAAALRRSFPTNWELSVARATNVVRYLQDVGVPPGRMVASGRAEYDPVAPNNTPDGRKKNRRIEIMLIDQSLVGEAKKNLK